MKTDPNEKRIKALETRIAYLEARVSRLAVLLVGDVEPTEANAAPQEHITVLKFKPVDFDMREHLHDVARLREEITRQMSSDNSL